VADSQQEDRTAEIIQIFSAFSQREKMNDAVIIIPYDPAWPKQYDEEKQRLQRALGSLILQVEHIGSTAVPGLGAKPIIDIMIALKDITDVTGCVLPLKNIGYEHLGENGISGRHFFRKLSKETGIRTHHLHIVGAGNEFVEKHLFFRDYLRTHPETAQQYYQLKKELAAKHSIDRDFYTNEKASFIEAILVKSKNRL
jgi:GrpB-like predicted nucleotidyltransferase (UPF0157 family)